MLLVGLALVAGAFVPASRLELERSIESLYAPDDPRLGAFRRSREMFGGDEFVLVAWDREEATAPESLDAISEFAAKLSAVPGVNAESTQDLSKVLRPANVGFLLRR
ncbi:MAG: RND family transporter, partial [Planctomycetota bacterium]